jgi:hypothetical protein
MISASPRLGAFLAGGVALVAFGLTAPVLADGHGANQSCGAYCPTGGEAGNGGGNAKHGFTAGSKGKADAKNPPGQATSGPADSNAGYECDRNQGVGKGNPAHSACGDSYPDEYVDN